MMCPNLTQFGEHLAPCGQCMPCRINKKRMWVGRMLLELNFSPSPASFVTMTYDDTNLPKNGSVDVSEVQKYIKRLREKSLGGFRYFAVGEYGDKSERPHYHMIAFNTPAETWEQVLRDTWHKGFVQVGEANQASMMYVANYTTKKMTSMDDERLDGKNPEFAVMSKKPPLGAAGINYIEDLLYTRSGAAALAKIKDVPHDFEYQGKKYPIGKYWVDDLRKRMGVEKPPTPDDWTVTVESILKDKADAQKKADKLWKHRKRKQTGRTL